jgi:hypothetical protein
MKFIVTKMGLPGGEVFQNMKANDPILFGYSQSNAARWCSQHAVDRS